MGDQAAEVTITSVAPAALDIAEITFEVSAEGFVQVEKTATGLRITAVRPTDGVFVLVKKGTEAIPIKVTVKPKVAAIQFSTALFPAGTTDKTITLIEGEQIPISMSVSGGGAIPDTVTLESANTEIVSANNATPPRALDAKRAFTEAVDVNVLSNGIKIDSFKVRVLERVSRIQPAERQVRITQKQFFDATANTNVMPFSALDIGVEGSRGNTLPLDRLSFRATPSTVAAVTPNGLQILGHGEVEVEISPKEETVSHPLATGSTLPPTTIILSIQPPPSSMVLQPNFFPLTRGSKTQDIQATVFDSENRTLDVNVEWQLKDRNDERFVRIFKETKNKAKVAVIAVKDTPVEIVARAGDKTESAFVLTKEESVPTAVDDILVRLDLVDDQMARDLYGKKTLDEFYVTKIRIYNNRTNPNGDLSGDSIIVFSESVEVGVSLEKKPERGGGEWSCLTLDEVQIIRSYLGLRNVNYMRDPNPDSPGGRGGRRVRDALNVPYQNAPPCPYPTGGTNVQSEGSQAYLVQFPIPYRPYTFEMVANTHDRRDERSTRARVLRALEAAGSATSFITSIAVPGGSSDLPLGLEKYRNMFLPGVDRLFPSLKEVHRQNLISQLMKPLEEVPSGSDISRVLFFPKREMSGVLPGYKVRINGISTYELKIQVAVVKKTNVEQQ